MPYRGLWGGFSCVGGGGKYKRPGGIRGPRGIFAPRKGAACGRTRRSVAAALACERGGFLRLPRLIFSTLRNLLEMVTEFDLQCADIFTRITAKQGIKKGANPRKWTAPECKVYGLHQFRKSNACPHFGQWISLCPRAMISSRVAKSSHISTPKASAILSRVGADGCSPIVFNNPLLVIPNFSAKAACVYPFSLMSSLILCFIFLIFD